MFAFLDRLSIETLQLVSCRFDEAAAHHLATGKAPLRLFDSAGICYHTDGTAALLANFTDGKGETFEDDTVWPYVLRWSKVTEIGIHGFCFESPAVTEK